MTYPCGHKNQMVDEIRPVTGTDGVTVMGRIPQPFRARDSSTSAYCPGCRQIVDAVDDAEREPVTHA